MAKFKSIKNQFEKGIRSVFFMQNIGNESRQEPKILKKKILKLMVDTWGNFSLIKEIPTTLKYFFKKIYDSFWNKTLWAR